MGHELVVSNKALKFSHRLRYTRSSGEHFITYSGVVFNKSRNTFTWIHEALKAIDDLIVAYKNGTHFDCSLSQIGGKASGFKVYNNDGIISHRGVFYHSEKAKGNGEWFQVRFLFPWCNKAELILFLNKGTLT